MNEIQRNENTVVSNGLNKRGALIYAIGILAFASAAVSLFFAVKEFLVMFEEAGGNIRALEYASLASIAIELVFSALEIVTGFTLIKQWRTGESIEIHKTVAKLIRVIVYEGFIAALTAELMHYIMSSGELKTSVSMIYIIAYILYSILMSAMSTLVKRNELMNLYYLMMITSFIAIGFSAGEVYSAISDADLIEMGFGFANVIVTSLIFAFAVSTVVYYVKNPEMLQHDVEVNEDSDLIKEENGYRHLKVYTHRANETGVNGFINAVYFLGIMLGCTGIVFFAIEQNVARFASGTLSGIIENIRNEFTSASISSISNLMLIFYILLIYPLSYYAAAWGIVKRDARSKISLATTTSIGTGIMIFANVFTIIGFIMDFTKSWSIDFKSMKTSTIALLALFVTYWIAQKFRKNKSKDLYESITQGDSYRSHFREIHRKIIFDGIFSTLALALMLYAGIENGETPMSYPFFIASVILVILGTHLESKHPFAEYTIVRRKVFKKTVEAVENTEQ